MYNYYVITDVVYDLYNMTNERNQNRMPIISDFHYRIIQKNSDRLNNAIKHYRDSTYSYFGFKVYFQTVFVYLLILSNISIKFNNNLLKILDTRKILLVKNQ